MKTNVIPLARIFIASNAEAYGEQEGFDDPWVIPSVAAINKWWEDWVEEGWEHDEKGPIVTVVRVSFLHNETEIKVENSCEMPSTIGAVLWDVRVKKL